MDDKFKSNIGLLNASFPFWAVLPAFSFKVTGSGPRACPQAGEGPEMQRIEVSQKAEFYANLKTILKVEKRFALRKVQAENFDEQFLKGRKTLHFLNFCLP